ncbi:MAG: hypothetical protein HY268_15405 [Deltaproteobacteria bacterium]|nr:hypothetical protein [Deltaproteobacteria bacterium]
MHTRRTYRAAVMRFVEFVGIRWPAEGWKLLQVGVPEVQAWRDLMIAEEIAPKTRNLRVCSLNNLYTFMRETAAELRLPITVPNPAHRMFLRRENADPVDETEALSVAQARQLLVLISYVRIRTANLACSRSVNPPACLRSNNSLRASAAAIMSDTLRLAYAANWATRS